MTPTQKTLYFDYNATTPLDPEVVQAMQPYWTQKFGNSMSHAHCFGWDSEEAVDQSRIQIAKLIHAKPYEITFTSGATEANNWALFSLIHKIRREEGPESKIHFLISPLEHASILEAAKAAQELFQVRVTYLPVNSMGQVDVDQIESLIEPSTRLLAAMWIQNEVGAINPVQRIGEICAKARIYFLCDATQAVGKVPVDLTKTHIDLMSFSSHKLYGPKGTGFLYKRGHNPHVQLPPLLYGGGHEKGLRSGTVNTPGIVGMAKACELAALEVERNLEVTRALQILFYSLLKESFPNLRLNGPGLVSGLRSPINLHLTFVGSKVPTSIKGLAVSQGAACHSGKTHQSHVLKTLGFSEAEALQSLRISLGRMTTETEVRTAVRLLKEQIKT